MTVLKVASVAVAALVGIGSSAAWAQAAGAACGAGACGVEKQAKDKACDVVKKECSGAKTEGVVNTEGLDALLKSKAPIKIFDARSGKWDDGKRIPGAQQLSADADEAVITQAIPSKETLVVTYCAGPKCPASKMLHDRLKKLGYSNVIEYPQGIAGWLEAGKAVEDKK